MLLPDRLRELWKEVDAGRMKVEQFAQIQEQELDGYRAEWRNALLESGAIDLRVQKADRLCPPIPVTFDPRMTKDDSFQRFAISLPECLQEPLDVIGRYASTAHRA